MRDKPKHPVRLTNKFVAKLAGEEMWWDDDPKATGSNSALPPKADIG